jgi:hypothetical protein
MKDFVSAPAFYFTQERKIVFKVFYKINEQNQIT